MGNNMKTFNVVIAGGRGFSDYELMTTRMDAVLKVHIESGYEITVISGTANGADKLGEQYAKDHGFKIVRMPAQWDTHGKSAGYKRNVEMADACDAIVVFWDGISKGTKHMYDIGKRKSIPTTVVIYQNNG
jgi:hypothetical protein